MEPKKLESTTAYKLTTNTEDSDVYIHNDEFGCGGDEVQVYLKSEADKYIESLYHRLQRANYKRCFAMFAYWIAVRFTCIDEKHKRRADKNSKRWLELSKRYRETV